MNFPILVQEFSDNFEDLNIWVESIEINKIKDIQEESLDKQTGTTGIWHQANIVGYPDHRTIVGGFYLIFRNQNKSDFDLALSMRVESRVDIKGDEKDAAAMTKYMQYLFEWFTNYVNDKKILDNTGKIFNLPSFHYTDDLFLQDFPN